MTNDNWDVIVVKKNNFDLNSLVNKDFLDELEKISEDKQVDCINLSFVVRDKEIKIDENSELNMITLQNNGIEDTLSKTVYLKTDFKISDIKKIIDNFWERGYHVY